MIKLFDKPKLIAVIGNTNSGKSNLFYHIIETLRKDSEFQLYTFGLKSKIPGAIEIFSLEELESIKDSLILTDETFSLFDLDHRGKKKQIEQTLRLLHHNNNILILGLLPENCKKFLASKLNAVIFKKSTLSDFVNGSMIKRIITQYRGPEMGNTILNVPINKALVFDGKNYKMLDIKYYPEYDSKAGNRPIIRKKTLFRKKAG